MSKKFFQTKVFENWAGMYRFKGRFKKMDVLGGKGGELYVLDISREIPFKTILKYMGESDDGRDDIAERISRNFSISFDVAHIALLLREETELINIIKGFKQAKYSNKHIVWELSQLTTHLPKTINALLRETK